MKKAIFTLVVSLLLVGCATRGSSAIDLGNGYIVATTAGSERWAIWGKIFEGQVGRSLIIWNKVSKIGVNKQYIIGLRESVHAGALGHPRRFTCGQQVA